MQKIMEPRLVPLSEAFERIGRTFVADWTGEERMLASLGQRPKGPREAWLRAQAAMAIARELARDGRLGIIAYDGRGGRSRYFEDVREEMSALLLPPDPAAPGLIELHSGTTVACEADISRLPSHPAKRAKPGRKPKFCRFEELIREGIHEMGPVASNTDLKNHARMRIGDQPYPEHKSTQNEIISRVRTRIA